MGGLQLQNFCSTTWERIWSFQNVWLPQCSDSEVHLGSNIVKSLWLIAPVHFNATLTIIAPCSLNHCDSLPQMAKMRRMWMMVAEFPILTDASKILPFFFKLYLTDALTKSAKSQGLISALSPLLIYAQIKAWTRERRLPAILIAALSTESYIHTRCTDRFSQ